jgi:hypothetical protein
MLEISKKVSIVVANPLKVTKQGKLARPIMIAPQIYKVFSQTVVVHTVTHKRNAIFFIRTQSIKTTSKLLSLSKRLPLIATMLVFWRVDLAISLTSSAI